MTINDLLHKDLAEVFKVKLWSSGYPGPFREGAGDRVFAVKELNVIHGFAKPVRGQQQNLRARVNFVAPEGKRIKEQEASNGEN